MSMRRTKKGPLIIDQTAGADDTWMVYPAPGFCFKFREPVFVNKDASTITIAEESLPAKFFVNVTHCMELPAPLHDVDEDEAARLIDTDQKDGFKVPLSLGELYPVEDRRGEPAQKVDVLVNSIFFRKRLETSEFYRQFTLLIILDAIAQRYGIRLDPSKQVLLKNRKCIGELIPQRIRKQPRLNFAPQNGKSGAHTHVDKTEPASTSAAEIDAEVVDIDDIEDEGEPRKPRNFKVQVLNADHVFIRIRVRDPTSDDEFIRDFNRLTLKMNDDRCVLLLDHERTIADFFLPFYLKTGEENSLIQAYFDSNTSTLNIRCPIDWKQPWKKDSE